MWTLSGPFDGETGDVNFQKSKLLKTGTTYKLGRKGCPLVIANKKISSHHCDFGVDTFSADDVGDSLKKPALKFTNMKDKPLRVARDGGQFNVNAQETCELRDGDRVGLISGLNVDVKWVPVCCYVQPVMGKSPVAIADCASLGLHVVHIPNLHVTHHIAPSYTAQPIIAASLLSASQFVKLEWLAELLRVGTLRKGSQDSLEHNFELPPLNKYRPAYSPSLPTSQKEMRVWEPNEERLNMFSAYRFLYVDEKNRIGDYKEVIERGGGSFETFDAAAGKLKFHRALTRGQAKEGKTQIVVGRKKSIIAAVGKEPWKELVEEAKSFGLHIVDPDVIVQVVIEVDTSLFNNPPSPDPENEELLQSTSLPDFIPNTHSEEPSLPPPEVQQNRPPKRLLRRATSRQPSQEPSAPATKTPDTEPEPEPEVAPPPRKPLTRRVKAGGAPLVIGFDDPSMILDAPPDDSALTPVPDPSPPPQPVDNGPPPVKAPRSSRLKRRVGALSQSGPSQAFGYTFEEPTIEPVEEPPLKKFKALFEASGRENMDSGTFDDGTFDHVPQSQPILDNSSQTQIESQTQGKKSRIGRTGPANLSTLREEEEESQASAVAPRGTKRGLEDVDEDVEIGDGDVRSSSSKKRAIEDVNAVEKVTTSTTAALGARATSKPPSSTAASKPITAHKGGAPPGKPDTDDKFLKAIASTKKGKKGEDDFDRDFNKLKISKPTFERADPEEEWALVADFGDDTNVRGNFMVVVEMPVYNRRRGKVDETPTQWEGKPNFKKFKKKAGTIRLAKVELFLNEENDYGMGPGYWKGGKSQDRHVDEYGLTQTQAAIKNEEPTQTRPSRSQAPMVIDDSDEDIAPIRRGKSKVSSRATSAVPPKRTSARSKAPAKSQPLFLEEDEDEDGVQASNNGGDVPDDSDDEQTLRSTRTRSTQKPPAKAKASTRKAVPILVDDDSDDGAVFKGFKGKRRR
ncbi:hypothetical protein H2248_001859 [Termitomyces sp. 'cryptogamus']|nr:hypothetical protein H2248_001859 [Termitomyces sp. 'cryptogamus']